MSYNPDSQNYIKGTGPLYMTPAKAREAIRAIGGEDEMPEQTFLTEWGLDGDGHPDDEPRKINAPWWYGEGSGNTWAAYLTALTFTTGSADILVVWEGGDSVGGVRVVDGKVTEHEVVHALGAMKKGR